MMKYKIVPNDIVKNLIEFLDEIQFEASKGVEPGDMQRINFCNYLIGELMNSLDGYIREDSDKPSGKKTKRMKDIDRLKKDFEDDFPEDMSEKDFRKLVDQFEAFTKAWDKEYIKSNHKDKAKETTSLKQWETELKMDTELTPNEKFELYYDERERRKQSKEEKGYTLDQLLKSTGIKKYKKR